MKGNLLVMHGGAPTAVINASLYGVIEEAKNHDMVNRILASDGGTGGFLAGAILDLTNIPQDKLDLLVRTPGSAIGTSRDHLEVEDYSLMAAKLEALGITYVLMTGGNGTMDTCKKLSDVCRAKGIVVCGIPKTMDNDLSKTDHSPGFASAARYLAGSVREVAQDVKGLAIHVVVVEAFGRDAGWLAASSVLAREREGDAPHMILCPETAFDEEAFLARVKSLYEEKHGVVVVASEGLRYKDGKPIVEPIFTVGRATYFGDVSAYLAQLVIKKLGIKARSEKPGILGRASAAWMSSVDRDEAIACGKEAVKAVTSGKHAHMAAIERVSTDPYEFRIITIPIDEEVIKARVLPETYIDAEHFDIDPTYETWLSPLVGGELGSFISFRK
ncbi:MAG: diphosphate--fructose-6-phosphate 1-phosphotransferase [Spirochaetia bacterium]|nr:diphosphate--fructose-6-phosphate 1-phosphotransferase [Spirochaetia bacterium]